MHQSIGVTATINIIIVFLAVAFAFIFGTMSYSKAFRASSMIVNALEKYEGYNALSKDEIEKKLDTLGYSNMISYGNDDTDIKCPATRNSTIGVGVLQTIADSPQRKDYCIYFFDNDGKDTSDQKRHYSYGVITYMELDFHVFGMKIRLPIYNHVRRIYRFNKTNS